MGFKFKNPVSALIGAGIGTGASTFLGGAGAGVGALAGSKFGSDGGLKNIFFGKDVVKPQDDVAPYLKETQLRASQAQRGGLESLMKQSPEQFAQARITEQGAALKGNLEDTRRQIQQNIARKGLQSTSLGQVAQNAAQRDIGKQLNLLQASAPLLQNQYAQGLIDAGAKVASSQNVPIRFEDEITKKQGLAGIFGLLGGAGLGAMAGGPQGAAAGSQIGYGAGTGLSSFFG